MVLMFLAAVRDALIAAALSWVGVTLETRAQEEQPRAACAQNTCAEQAR